MAYHSALLTVIPPERQKRKEGGVLVLVLVLAVLAHIILRYCIYCILFIPVLELAIVAPVLAELKLLIVILTLRLMILPLVLTVSILELMIQALVPLVLELVPIERTLILMIQIDTDNNETN